MKTWHFSAVDTWFFRESRPHESVGGSELASIFPPPPRTVAGAIRTGIGEMLGADWRQFRDDVNYSVQGARLRDMIGYADDMGGLHIKGPWLVYEGENTTQNSPERLYPWPQFVLARTEAGNNDEHVEREFRRLQTGAPSRCHLGRVRLPTLPPDTAGYKVQEDLWLTQSGLQTVLEGKTPSSKQIVSDSMLFSPEPRVGIARDNAERTAREGMLYQTRHVRPQSGCGIEVDVDGADDVTAPALIRFGGEGRLAGIDIRQARDFIVAPVPDKSTRGIILVMLTAACFENGQWLPEGFVEINNDDVTCWQGIINDVALTIHSAVIGKVRREGGWDVANHQPRTVRSLVPAGSAYYCTVEGDINEAIAKLHSWQIGEEKQLGRGLVAVGLWNDTEYFE